MNYDIKRVLSVLAMCALLTVTVAACGSDDGDAEPTVTRIAAENAPSPGAEGEEPAASPVSPEATTAPSDGGEAPAPDGGGTTVDVEMVDLAFEPTEITIAGNTDVTFNLTNSGALQHNLTIEGGPASDTIDGGSTGTLVVNLAPGTYKFICSVPGHAEAGMTGTLTVQ